VRVETEPADAGNRPASIFNPPDALALCQRGGFFKEGKMNAKEFIDNLSTMKWFAGAGKINPVWKMFDTRDAARDAAKVAAWDAALDAAWGAAKDAAWGAALDAALDAARDAAKVVERDAVWDAARVAAKVAAKVAARDAVWDASGDAVWDAARIAGCLVVAELIDKKHIGFCDEVAEIWSAGYGRYATIDSVHYVYTRLGRSEK